VQSSLSVKLALVPLAALIAAYFVVGIYLAPAPRIVKAGDPLYKPFTTLFRKMRK
jgi:hypothetical protein